ncbi:MAG TPA: hypothetical protein VMT69_02360 [Kineosporiaceae bacterium]|nr:hypothetical protein [Kineosporiaceae bacterium]
MTAGDARPTSRAGEGAERARRDPGAEQRLLGGLATWATWSVGVGGVLWRLGRQERAPALRAAGRTCVAWGLADGAVVAWGVRQVVRRRGASPPAADHARRMALLTGANALADVGYVLIGGLLSASPRRRGVGLATTVQGAFLLYLDTRYCLEFVAASRDAPPGGRSGPLDSPRARDRRRPAVDGGAGPGANDSVVFRTVS